MIQCLMENFINQGSTRNIRIPTPNPSLKGGGKVPSLQGRDLGIGKKSRVHDTMLDGKFY